MNRSHIQIGLAGWGDHPLVYPAGMPAGRKFAFYSRQFPVVEVDNSFYAVPSSETVQRWVDETAADFGFVVKANQAMTGHERGRSKPTEAAHGTAAEDVERVFAQFRESFAPMLRSGKLRAILFQYPPWFDCNREHISVLRRAKQLMEGWPVGLEFRHQSWFAPELRSRTLSFMEREGWMHSVCDEPQTGSGSVPTVAEATHPQMTVVRFHGRNAQGWNASGSPNWRAVRYLYDYSDAELSEWIPLLDKLAAVSKEICVIFNNNSGGHGATNAKRLMCMLGLKRGEPAPEQLNLFDL